MYSSVLSPVVGLVFAFFTLLSRASLESSTKTVIGIEVSKRSKWSRDQIASDKTASFILASTFWLVLRKS